MPMTLILKCLLLVLLNGTPNKIVSAFERAGKKAVFAAEDKKKGKKSTSTRGTESNNRRQHNESSKAPRIFSSDLQHELNHIGNDYLGLNQTTVIDQATLSNIVNAAERGRSVESAYFLGMIYAYGLASSVQKVNFSQAEKWFRVAAKEGNSDSQCALGLLLYHGAHDENKRKINLDDAKFWFSKASDQGNPRGHWLLGRAILDEWEETIDWVQMSGGSDLAYSESRHKDFKEATRLLTLAAKSDVKEAIHHLALLYEYDIIPYNIQDGPMSKQRNLEKHNQHDHNMKKAADLYKQGSDLGSAESAYNLGLMFAYGRGLQQNFIAATDMFRKAAVIHNHAPSMRYLGILAVSTYGLEEESSPDYKKGLFWFSKCAALHEENISNLCWNDKNQLETMFQYANEEKARKIEILRSRNK